VSPSLSTARYDPAIDGAAVDLDAALGHQLLDISVAELEAAVPANAGQDDCELASILARC